MPLASAAADLSSGGREATWRGLGKDGDGGVFVFGDGCKRNVAEAAADWGGKNSALSTKESSYQSLAGGTRGAGEASETEGCGTERYPATWLQTGGDVSQQGAEAPPADEEAPLKLRIVHFNDVYNVFPTPGGAGGGAASFCTGVQEKRGGRDGLVLFSGDIFSPAPLSEACKGRQMVELLNHIGVHTACYGNHDLDFGWEWLELLAGSTDCKWVMSNAKSRGGQGGVLANAQRYRIFEWGAKPRLTVGIMGLIEEDWIDTLNAPDRDDIIYQDFVEAGREMAALFRRRGCDLVIALTHMRWNNDERLAREVSDIDLILGGHDHGYLTKIVSGKAVIKSGSDFREFSSLTLTPKLQIREQGTSHPTGPCEEHKPTARGLSAAPSRAPRGAAGGALMARVLDSGKPIASSKGSVRAEQSEAGVVENIETAEGQPAKVWSSGRWWISCEKVQVSGDRFEADDGVMEMLARYQTEYSNPQGGVIGVFPVRLETRFCEIRTRECNSGNWLADLMREHVDADVALYNSGGIRSDCVFAEGEVVTDETLHALLSGTRHLCVVGVPGRLFKRILETSVSKWPQLEGRFLQVSGLRFVFDGSKAAGARVLEDQIRVLSRETHEWEPIVDGRVYSVTTAKFLACGGDGFSVMSECSPVAPASRAIKDLSHLARLWLCRHHRQCGHQDAEDVPEEDRDWIDRVHMREENHEDWRIQRIG
ncbi:5'-nucleotidase, C-terminal domain-containing protein [Besnoitia besnoiti]|uniref:5'-nucleotidase, C-terminal domain-containing protein n=1 Tax=Besnoitia besnoiti TaxID=94643 RepID=A0A2A9MFN8_BESBE|nr:5'-nucleotidase, C-terminal domain-containing protein [Besnoitia besnoiti]PFH34786.1 5'-nucleotidase, C-terminal domain-containing protein [Besnoitia besnoiti]